MSMTEWAEREVELACKRENPDRKEGEWDYGCACYESALKAYKCLMEDGHSGMSFSFTRQILERLMRNLPLTPIEDTPDIWRECSYGRKDGMQHYQCIRKSSLFKDVGADGTVTYHDIDRFVAVSVNNENSCWRNKLVDRLCGEIYPITFPYIPKDKPYKVYCDECLTDTAHGDYDTYAILYIVAPDGTRRDIYRYFKSDNSDWEEITWAEYAERVRKDKERRMVND